MTKEELQNKVLEVEKLIVLQKRIAESTRESSVLEGAYDTIRVLNEYRQELNNQLGLIAEAEMKESPTYSENAAMFK